MSAKARAGGKFHPVDRLIDHTQLPDGTLLYKVMWKGGEVSWEPESNINSVALTEYRSRSAPQKREAKDPSDSSSAVASSASNYALPRLPSGVPPPPRFPPDRASATPTPPVSTAPSSISGIPHATSPRDATSALLALSSSRPRSSPRIAENAAKAAQASSAASASSAVPRSSSRPSAPSDSDASTSASSSSASAYSDSVSPSSAADLSDCDGVEIINRALAQVALERAALYEDDDEDDDSDQEEDSDNAEASLPAPPPALIGFNPLHPFQLERPCTINIPGHQPRKLYRPLFLFQLFITIEMMQTIADNTNMYATELNAGDYGRPWEPVTVRELYGFFAILLYSGIYRIADFRQYWRRKCSPLRPKHPIAAAMTLTRYEQLKRYIKLSNPQTEKEYRENPASAPPEMRSFGRKVLPFFDELFRNFRKYVTPGSHVSIDETMVRFSGRSIHTYTIKAKPIPEGYKLYILSLAGGYIWAYVLMSRSDKSAVQHLIVGDLSITESAVLHLCLTLPRANNEIYFTFMDNFFSTPRLFEMLREYGIAACGTVRIKHITSSGKEQMKGPHAWGTVQLEALRNSSVLNIRWLDSKWVLFLSTMHTGTELVPTERHRPKSKLSLHGKSVEKLFGKQRLLQLPTPKVVIDYNTNKGHVDTSDQLRAMYTSMTRCNRNWFPLLIFALDAAVDNAYRLLKLGGCNQPNHELFRFKLVEEMFHFAKVDNDSPHSCWS